jgi:hypothetical protein
LFGATVQLSTWQAMVTTMSQNAASFPAQSSGVVQGVSSPVGGRWQTDASVHA